MGEIMDKRITILKEVVRHPVKAFREIDKNGREYLMGAIFILLISPFLSWIFSPEFFTISRSIVGLVYMMVFIVSFYCIGRSLKGKAEFTGLFSALGYSYFPSIFSSIIFGIVVRQSIETLNKITALRDLPQEEIATKVIPLFKELFTPVNIFLGAIALLVGVWEIILIILACREAHKFSTIRAVGTLIITVFIAGIIVNLINHLVIW